MIETPGGPVIAMILFLMPMYAIQKVPAMRKYSGHVSNIFVVIMGLIAISAIFYPCTPCSDYHPRRPRTAHSSSLTESNGRIMISVFDIFKIGIGPSSSHTVGPMKAGKQFTDDLIARGILHDITRVVVDVYGSLSLTGKGHHTDIAIIMGPAGNLPDTVDIDAIPGFIQTKHPRSPAAGKRRTRSGIPG